MEMECHEFNKHNYNPFLQVSCEKKREKNCHKLKKKIN